MKYVSIILTQPVLLKLCLLIFILMITEAKASPVFSPLKSETALSLKSFANCSPVAMSPDGSWVAYTVKDPTRQSIQEEKRYEDFSRTGMNQQAVGCSVWVSNTRTRHSTLIQETGCSSSSPVWSPDGKSLAFFSDSNGTAALWIWELKTRQARQVSTVAIKSFNTQVPQWSPDGKSIAVRVSPAGAEADAIDNSQSERGNPPRLSQTTQSRSFKSKTTVTVYTSEAAKDTTVPDAWIEQNSWIDLNRYNADFAIVDIATGHAERIAQKARPAGSWLSPDGKYLAYMNLKGIKRGSRDLIFQLVTVDLSNRSQHILCENVLQDFGYNVSWSPDSKFIAYLNADSNADGDCYVVSIDGSECRNLTAGKHAVFRNDYRAPLWNSTGSCLYLFSAPQNSDTVWRVSTANSQNGELEVAGRIPHHLVKGLVADSGGQRVWSPNGGRTIAVGVLATDTKMSGFYLLDLTSRTSSKLFEEKASYGFDFYNTDGRSNTEQFIYTKETVSTTRDLWMTNADGESRHRVSDINPTIHDTTFGASEVISYSDQNGKTLNAALLLPANYEQGKRYPLIVTVYGGSMGSDSVNHFGMSGNGTGTDNMQLLACRGYAVLKPDIPIQSESPMTDILKAVISAIDRVEAMGIADPERLAIWGHSYGGYSTLGVIVQTQRFRTAIASSGASDLISLYGTLNDAGVSTQTGNCEGGQGRMVGTPWQFRERYLQNSPIFYIDKVASSLLLTHGTLDEAVPCQQAEEVYVALRRLGKEVAYAKYSGEGHVPASWSYDNALDYCNRVIDWFDNHLR